jgi:hypothetical protein
MRLRREKPSAPVIESAIAMETFRPGFVAAMITRGQQLPLDHPVVRNYPEYFKGLVSLTGKEVDNAA